MSDQPSIIASASERMVFSVASSDRKYPNKRYRVDLLANRGAGWCACKNHAIEAQPAINQAMPIITRRTSCKHVRKCWVYFLRQILPDMAKANGE